MEIKGWICRFNVAYYNRRHIEGNVGDLVDVRLGEKPTLSINGVAVETKNYLVLPIIPSLQDKILYRISCNEEKTRDLEIELSLREPVTLERALHIDILANFVAINLMDGIEYGVMPCGVSWTRYRFTVEGSCERYRFDTERRLLIDNHTMCIVWGGSLDIPEGIRKIGDFAFAKSHIFGDITLPESVTEIGAGAFYQCTDLRNITLPSSLCEIGESAFEMCTGIHEITIPPLVKILRKGVFKDSGLYKVTIPSNVKTVCAHAFERCSELKEVTISEGVTLIQGRAFYDCFQLESVIIKSRKTQVRKTAFLDSPCRDGLKAQYILT